MANTSFVGMTLPKVGGGEEFFFKDLKTNCDETGDEELSAVGWQAESDIVNLLDEQGTFKKMLCYLPAWIAGPDGYNCPKGWYERDNYGDGLDYNHSEDFCCEPGEGFQVSIFDASLGATVSIKSALATNTEE